MRALLRIILNTLFPLSVHGKILAPLSPLQFSLHYNEIPVHDVITLAHYHTPRVQAAIAACKFENNHQAAELLAALLTRFLIEHPREGTTLLIPVPLSHTREKERGFNQVKRVLSYSDLHTHQAQIAPDLIRRTKHTERQTSLNRADRLRNMTAVFEASPSIHYYSFDTIERIIICDDVLTTGATLGAAKAALLPHLPPHIELTCVAWAH